MSGSQTYGSGGGASVSASGGGCATGGLGGFGVASLTTPRNITIAGGVGHLTLGPVLDWTPDPPWDATWHNLYTAAREIANAALAARVNPL